MKYQNQTFTGERALFMSNGLDIEECLFNDGESPLKESHNFKINKSIFAWKYPMWYSSHFTVNGSKFEIMARAAVWYSHDFEFVDFISEAPKSFRESYNFDLKNVEIKDGAETCWWCHDFEVSDSKIVGADYFAMKSKNIIIKNVDFHGKYAFDGVENVVVENCKLMTKDVFWNSKHVLIKNCYIESEYFGWNSEDITLVNCEVHSHQGFCYMKNIKLVNCKLVDTDLCFEYCQDIDAEIVSKVDSIKNPLSGRIKVKEVGEIIFDDPNVDKTKTEIIIG